MRNALEIKMHTTPTQPQEYVTFNSKRLELKTPPFIVDF